MEDSKTFELPEMNDTLAPMVSSMQAMNDSLAPMTGTMQALNDSLAPNTSTIQDMNDSSAPMVSSMEVLTNSLDPNTGSMDACGSSDTHMQLSSIEDIDDDTLQQIPTLPTGTAHDPPPNYEEKYNNYAISEDRMSSDDSDQPYALDDHVAATDIEIVNNLTCCLSFLLHQQSPLWTIYNNDETSSFQSRCAHWQSHYRTLHKSTSPTVNAQHTLHKLPPDDDRHHRWPLLMHFWASWMKDKDTPHCDVDSLNWNQLDIHSIKGTIEALSNRSAALDAEDRLLRQSTIKPKAGAIPLATQDSMEWASKKKMSLTCSPQDTMREFETIDSVNALQNYLRKNKIPSMQYQDVVDEHELNIRKLSNHPKLQDMRFKLKGCMSGMKQQMCRSIKDSTRSIVGHTVVNHLENDESFQLCIQIGRLPMTEWKWTHVVYWCEKALPSNLKPFAVLFHEWRIDGNELMVMTEKHIACLIKCSYGYPANYELLQLLNTKDINQLITEIRKCLIQTTIAYQYDVYWRALKQIKVKPSHPLFGKVWNIIHLIHFLRPGYSQGPKALWKWDAMYFAKIDNILSILIASTKCQKLFQSCFPRFIFDDKMPHPLKAMVSRHNIACIANTHKSPEHCKDSISMQIMQQVSTHNSDSLDKIANKCCGEESKCPNRYCVESIHEFDRVYCNVMMMLCLCVTLCCVTTICFMSYKSEYEINKLMSWATESIGERTMTQASYQFSVIQMVLSVAVNELYNSAIPINVVEYTDGRYDRFFTQYHKYKASESTVYSLYMYELQSGTMMGSWTDRNRNQYIYVFTPDTGCGTNYAYDTQMEKRNESISARMTCGTYDPTTRPWYILAAEQENGFIGWTEPYELEDGAIGMTLVHKLLYNDVEVMFFTEWLVDTMERYVSDRGVQDMIIYMVTTQGNVIASDDHTTTDDPLITESVTKLIDGEYLMDIANEYVVLDLNTLSDEYRLTLYAFHTLNTNINQEHGAIVLLQPYTQLDAIQSAETASIVLYAVSLSLALLLICFMGKQLGNVQKLMQYKSPELRQTATDVFDDDTEYTSIRHRCFCEHKTLLFCSFWYCVVVFITTYWIWHAALQNTLDEIMDQFLNQEYYAIHDTTSSMIDIAQTITDIVEERLNSHLGEMSPELLTSSEFSPDIGIYLTHLMHTFRWMDDDDNVDDDVYYVHGIYIGTPDGKFIGVLKDSNAGLLTELRDDSTDWELTYTRMEDKIPLARRDDYDPLCRDWYRRTLEYMVDCDINCAFGGVHNLNQFYSSQTCVEIQQHYLDIWNLDWVDTYDNITIVSDDMNTIYRNEVLKNISYECSDELRGIRRALPKYDVVWSKYLFASGSMGLTVSKPILDIETGDVLAIIAVDLTLDGLSAALNRTNNYNMGEKDWISWIFSAHQDGYEMIASSEGNVTVNDTEKDGLIPYDVRSHPNAAIRIDSQQIIDLHSARCGSSALPINTTQRSHQVALPQDNAFLLAGRLSSYPSGDNGVEIDWIIAKSIDINNFKAETQENYEIIAFVMICTLLCIWYVEQSIHITSSLKQQNVEEDEDDAIDQNKVDDKGKLNDLYHDLEDIVEGSSSEIWGIFLKQYFANDSKHGVLTAGIAKEFMAKESNKHVLSNADHHFTLLLCALRINQKWTALRIMSFICSSRYNAFVTICLMIHCVCCMYLPPTPNAHSLLEPGVMSVISVLIIIEIIDAVFVGIVARYIEFRLVNRNHLAQIYRTQFGFNHDYVSQIQTKSLFWLMLFGTHRSNVFLIHLLMVILITVNAILMSMKQIGIFEYYIPIVPLLLAVRCRPIRSFCMELLGALYAATNVFVSYFFFITIVSIFAQAMFKDIRTDALSDTARAWITSFVFVSTGDNYNDTVSHSLDVNVSVLNLLFFVVVFVVGSFFFIPIIIRTFQTAFHDLCASQKEDEVKRKTNSYVAAFIYYDGSLSLSEFVAMCHTQHKAQPIQMETHNNRWQSYLECNLFRSKNNRLYVLILLIIPSIAVALIRGISTDHNEQPTTHLIGFFFVCNFIDINLRLWAFGRKRYGSLNQYRNPPFVEDAILNYRRHRVNGSNSTKLTHIEKQWTVDKLEPTQAMSKSQKQTLSVVHRYEVYLIWCGLIGYLLTFIVEMKAYRFLFLQIYLLRIFSVIESNQKLIVLLFRIVPRFVRLMAFLMVFILVWARIGCTMFARKTENVPPEIRDASITSNVTSFDGYATSFILLLQMMIGKGWHQIMYLYTIATSLPYAVYFIIYIVVVALIVPNIAIALMMDACDDEINELDDHRTPVTTTKQILKRKLSSLQDQVEETLKQMKQIDGNERNAATRTSIEQKDKDTQITKTKDTEMSIGVLTSNASLRKMTQI
eukprot:697854_1